MVESVAYTDFCIQTRPEIRKGCVWDVGLLFSLEALEKHKLKEIYLEKPRVQRESGAYLCLKVRSKLIQKEIGFGKVGELEHDRPYIEPNSLTGSATLKVKFMQRPRAVFHKHADVMVLVISLRSCTTNEVILTAEHELIFRGGTGSMHSADSRKKNSGPSSSLTSSSAANHHHSHHAHQAASSAHHNHHNHLHHSALSHSHSLSASQQGSNKALPNASPYWDDVSANQYSSKHLPEHVTSGSQASIHSSILNGAQSNGKTTRSNRTALSLISASSSLPLPSPFAKPSPSHIALSDAVTRAHPQSASLFPVSTKSSAGPGALPSLLSASEDPLSDSALFFQGNGTFFFDANTEAGENQPHMEVQPLTLATIQEFQIGLQEHCSAASLLPKSSDSNTTDDYDMATSLSPTAGLTEESTTELDDARELEAWAKSYGIDTSIFTPGASSLDGVPADASTFPSMHQEAMMMADTNFLPSNSLSDAMAFNTSIMPSHADVPQDGVKQDAARYSVPVESGVKLEVLESYTDGDATEDPTQNSGQVPGATAAASAPSSSSGASHAPGIEGAITRGRAARIRGESFHARKRRAGFDPEDIPYGKMPCLNGASPSAAHLVDGLHPAAMAMGGSFEDKVFQKLFFRSLTFLSLEELRALAQSAPLPIFVKDEQGAYLLANPAFCSFIYDDSWDAIAHRSAEDLLEAEESEPIHRADEYIKAREGNIGTFYLSVRNQDYKVMKLYTKLRDCEHKLVVGAVTF